MHVDLFPHLKGFTFVLVNAITHNLMMLQPTSKPFTNSFSAVDSYLSPQISLLVLNLLDVEVNKEPIDILDYSIYLIYS